MPVYTIQDSRGRIMEVEGDHEPNEQELTGLFAQGFPEPAPPTTQPPHPVTESGMEIAPIAEPMPGARVRPGYLTQETLPGTVSRGVSDATKGMVTGLFTPEGLAIAGAQLVPGLNVAVDTALVAAAAKQAAGDLGEYVATGNKEKLGSALAMGAAAAVPAVTKGRSVLKERTEYIAGKTAEMQAVDRAVKAGMTPDPTPLTTGELAKTKFVEPLSEGDVERLFTGPETAKSDAELVAAAKIAQAKVEGVPEVTLTPPPTTPALTEGQAAPTPTPKETAPAQAAAKVEQQVKTVAKTEGQRPAKDIKSELVDRIERAIDVAPNEGTSPPNWEPWITIEIPGDGTFKIGNTKEQLGQILKRAKRIDTSSFDVKPKIPKKAIESSTAALRGVEEEKAKGRAADLEKQKEKARGELYDAINQNTSEGMVGRSLEVDDPALDNGKLWKEYRIRLATPEERTEYWKQNRRELRWVGEGRTVRFSADKGRTEGEWFYGAGDKTRADVVRTMVADVMPADSIMNDPGFKAWQDLERGTPPPSGETGPGIPDPIKSSPITTPSPPSQRPLGIVSSSTPMFLQRLKEAYWEPFSKAFGEFNLGAFAQRTLPRITKLDREVGESGGRHAAARSVGHDLGIAFADEVTDGLDLDNRKFGVALKEDNLRDIREYYRRMANEARAKAAANPNADSAFIEDAAMYDDAADAVVTLVGADNSPFRTEADYQAFLADPTTQTAIERHIQLWPEQKEPLYREAADIDPETELASRGLQTEARINLTHTDDRAAGVRPIGTGREIRQLGTLLQRDPFARRATGTGMNYEAGYRETMARAFEQEYPVSAQHEFIRKLIESGIAREGKSFKPPGPEWKSYPLRIKPWQGRNLYLPRELAGEYEPLVGLEPGARIPVVTPVAELLTHQSIMGLGEGTAHSANILLKLFTGITTSHPLFESFLSALPFRPDVLYALPRALIRGLRPDSKAMLELAKINAAKRPYSGWISSRFLNPLDKGVRLLSKDVYEGLAERGIVPDTETGLREFVNEIGNYNTATQSWLVRNLRTSGVQPFATGFRTATVQAVKRLFLGSGLEGTTKAHSAALRTAIAAKFVGTILTVGTLNYLLTGKSTGMPGTRIGSVSWEGEDGRTRELDLAGLMGATTGLRKLGVMPFIEMKARGVDTGTAGKAGAKSLANTVISQLAGPMPRFLSVGLTGKDPYGYQIAPMAPPTEDVFNSQVAKNVEAALQSANPLVDVALSAHQGKTWDEIRQRQLTRYATRTPSGVQTSDNFAEIVAKANLNEYADWLTSQARKRPVADRMEFVLDRLDKDKVEGIDRKQVMTELKRKGAYKYD